MFKQMQLEQKGSQQAGTSLEAKDEAVLAET
jgi:hypothetical protein